MNDWLNTLIRPELIELQPYESARRLFEMSGQTTPSVSWLNANENPYLPKFEVHSELYNRYPDFQPEGLVKGYANYAGIAPSQLVVTRGADEGIELLIRTFCSAGEAILINPPTYGMYAISAATNGVITIKVETLGGFQLDVQQIIKQAPSAKLVFICSPNNPTGQIINQNDIVTVLESCPNNIVVVDEAYIEFCPEASVISLINKYKNLVILRTLSKAFGLAGLRCGVTISNPDIINAVKKVIAPYPVPAPVADIASQVLTKDGINWMQDCVARINQDKKRFIEELERFTYIEEIYPSATNFVLMKLNEKVTSQYIVSLGAELGVLLRDQSKQLNLNNTVRVTIGTPEQLTLVLELFTKIENTL